VPLGLGIASLLLGCVALMLGLVPYAMHGLPFVSVVSVVMAVLGMLLGLGGLQMALVRKGHGIGLPFAGSTCNVVALGTACALAYVAEQGSATGKRYAPREDAARPLRTPSTCAWSCRPALWRNGVDLLAWFKSWHVRVTPERSRVCVTQRNAIH